MADRESFTLVLRNRQRGLFFNVPFIHRVGVLAHPLCVRAAKSDSSPLVSLPVVEASIVSDKVIAGVHAQFLDDPTPTDVITFDHGEIVIGAGVVSENGLGYGHSPTHEAALCLIHGMLHLAGWKDATAKQAQSMAARQEQIFNSVLRMVE